MKTFYKMLLAVLVMSSLVGCDLLDIEDDSTSYDDPDTAVTENISFSGGYLEDGNPPSATNNAGDPYLSDPVSSSNSINPGTGGELSIVLNNMDPNQNFNVNVQFGSANQYINIPVSGSTLGGATGGTLNLPFSMPSDICDNIDDIQHQIQCYESVDIGNGVKVSKQTARSMLLACESQSIDDPNTGFATGASDYCVDGYPQQSCTILQDSGYTTQFVTGSSCSSSYPNSSYLGDYGTCGLDGITCGTCAVEIPTTNSPSRASSVEDQIYSELLKLQNDPEARRQITFTPNPQ